MKPLFDKPTSVDPCTQQDIETILELAIKLGVPIFKYTILDYNDCMYNYVMWSDTKKQILRCSTRKESTVTASEFIARMHEWAAKNNPKVEEWQPKRGDWVEVSNDNADWEKRIFLAEIKGILYPIRALNEGYEKAFEEDKYITESGFKYMREIRELELPKEDKLAQVIVRLKEIINELENTKA